MIKKISLIFMTVLILIFSISLSATAAENNGYVRPPIDLSYLADNPPQEVNVDGGGRRLLQDITPPSKYDLRNVDGKSYVTSVKNQNPYGTCWAFASIGAMESNYLMQGLGSDIDLSEMHLAWFTFKNSDKSKAFKNITATTLSGVLQGGHSFYPTALYSRLDGPVLDSEVPYSTAPSASTPDSYTRVLRLRDVYYLSFSNDDYEINASSSNRNIIKRRIMQVGGVAGSYYNNDSAYTTDKDGGYSFYSKVNDETRGHAILIVGWDDNYSKDNFKTKPSSDGAWLIKNSWGTSWGDEGYFWMSYEQDLTDGTAFIVEKADDDMKAYYYDALGWCGNSSVPYAANVFKSERNEILTEVGFYTPDNNVGYEINIYTGMSSMPSSNPINGSSVSTTTGTEAFAGYHTVTLDTPVTLTEGGYFSVVIKFTGTSKFPVEMKTSGYSDNAVIEKGSFSSSNGSSWSARSDCNFCIKAFTVTASNTPPKITTTYLPDGLIGVAYSQKMSASGARSISWSSTSGTIPPGLNFSSPGTLSGTPTVEGDYTFSITAANSYGSDTKEFTISIIEQPEILTSELTGYVGCTFSENLELSAGNAASWTITSGKLPKGLTLNTSTGAITGKPTAKTSTSVTFKAAGTSWEVEKAVYFTINSKPTKPTISTSKLKDGEIGEEYSANIKTSGTAPITLSANGLPNGLSMNEDGEISGTPAVAGNFTITVTASNIYTELNNVTITKKVKLKIKAKAPVINTPSELPMAVLNQNYEGYIFTLSEGTEPVTWSASSLPKGLSLSSSGVLSGKPTKAGKFNMTIKAKNDRSQASIKVPLIVYQIPEITTTKLSNGVTDKKYTVRLAAKGTTPITWNISGLPETLTAAPNTTGTQLTISGTPTEADTYTLSITASNEAGDSEEKTLSLVVKGVAPKLTASLAKAEVDEEYTGSKISAKGTLPIEFSYEIKDTDKTKFGINDLSDIGLSFTSTSSEGTAAITGTPNQSIKNLPIYITADNVAGTVTKKLTFTAKGDKPSFTSSTPASLTKSLGSSAEINVTVEGSPKITLSMNKVSGFTLTQNDNYSATITGTAPAKAGKVNLKITAANADGKVTKTIILYAKKDTDVSEAPKVLGETQENSEEAENTSDEISQETQETEPQETPKDSGVVNFGGLRSIKSLGSKELQDLEGYTVAAVLPEITVTESDMYDFEVDLEPEIEAGKELAWFAFVKNREKNSDDEIAEFFDTDGREITKTTTEHKIIISVWLNAGDTYEPVIAVKNDTK